MYHHLMNGKNPGSLLLDWHDSALYPGYNEGVRDALNEIREDPTCQEGHNDAENKRVNQQKMRYPYYRQGVLDDGDDSAGQTESVVTGITTLGLGAAAGALLRTGLAGTAVGDAATQSTPGPAPTPGSPPNPSDRKTIRDLTGLGPRTTTPPLRMEYVNEVRRLHSKLDEMQSEGKNWEEIARTLNQERRDLGEKFKDITPPDLRERIYQRNIERYQDPLGPTVEWFRKRGVPWEDIARKACKPGGADFGL